MYVDAHVHLGRYPDPSAILRDVESERIVCVSVTDTPSEYRDAVAWLRRPPLVEVALGVHPLRAGELGGRELSLFDDLVGGCGWVGEVGLDGSPDGRPTLPAQRRAFERVLAHPATRGKVLTVHSRGAETEVVAALARARVAAVLHWYRGSLDDAEAALAAGLHFSINPAMVRCGGARRLLAALPPERVLTETDGPYTSVGPRPSAPRDVGVVLAVLAEHWQVDVQGAARRVRANLEALRSPPAPGATGH
ncbi:MAG: TatD family hydrolase [Solirubrobacteraceae bacterium]